MARTFRTRVANSIVSAGDTEERRLGDVFHKTQTDTDKSFNAIVPDWIRNGKLIEHVEVNPGSFKRVPHGLGRHHKGWLILSPRATSDPRVWEVRNQRDKNVLVLQSTNAVDIDIWIW